MTQEEMIDALAEMPDVPFGRKGLAAMEPEALAYVANEAGADFARLVLEGRVGGLRARVDDLSSALERDGLVTNTPPRGKRLSFQVRSTLGVGPGDKSRFEQGDGSQTSRSANSRDGGGSGLSFKVRSTLGAGPGDASRFDES